MEHFLTHLKHQPWSHDCTHFVNVLKVKPGIEWSDGQIQIWQLEVCYSSAYISLISVDAKSSETQTVFLQSGQVHGDGVVLVKNHRECVCLDLWEAGHEWAVMEKVRLDWISQVSTSVKWKNITVQSKCLLQNQELFPHWKYRTQPSSYLRKKSNLSSNTPHYPRKFF